MPGTHDLALLASFFEDLHRLHEKALSSDQLAGREPPVLPLPRFDKAADDRVPLQDWPKWEGSPVHVVLFDGWCVGIPSLNTLRHSSLSLTTHAETEAEAEAKTKIKVDADAKTEVEIEEDLFVALNHLERSEDPTGVWRNYVEASLQQLESLLFSRFDLLLFLKVPDFQSVVENRKLQEKKLGDRLEAEARENEAALTATTSTSESDNACTPTSTPTPTSTSTTTTRAAGRARTVMSEAEVERFVQFSERWTRRSFRYLPQIADITFELDRNQEVTRVRYKETETAASSCH